MNRLLSSLVLALLLSLCANAQTPAPDAATLTALLNNFLAGAGRNDAEIHNSFWAEDLIYTGAAGRRVSKADIMKDLRTPAPTPSVAAKTTYSAEEIRIQQYGDTAIVAFRLVATVERGKSSEITKYFNTGTFLKREGKWQAVAWQATRLPRPEESAKQEVTELQSEFQRALIQGDAVALQQVIDDGFIWTQIDGVQINRQQLIELVKARKLRFATLGTNATISLAGDTAVVRGVSLREPNVKPGQTEDSAPAAAGDTFHTIVATNKGGSWKVFAMHSSRR